MDLRRYGTIYAAIGRYCRTGYLSTDIFTPLVDFRYHVALGLPRGRQCFKPRIFAYIDVMKCRYDVFARSVYMGRILCQLTLNWQYYEKSQGYKREELVIILFPMRSLSV